MIDAFKRVRWRRKLAGLAASLLFTAGTTPACAQELSPSVVLTKHADTTPGNPAPLKGLPPIPTAAWMEEFRAVVISAAQVNGLPPNLVMAVIAVESGYNPKAMNGTSTGLMQIKPPTARSVGWEKGDLIDPIINIRVATNYLAIAYKMVDGDICRTVSKYNRGLASQAISHAYCAKIARIMDIPAFHAD